MRGKKGRIRAQSLLEQVRRYGNRQVFAFDGHGPTDALLALAHAVASNWRAACTKVSHIRQWQWRWTPSHKDRQSHPDLLEDAAVEVWLHEVSLDNGETLHLVSTW